MPPITRSLRSSAHPNTTQTPEDNKTSASASDTNKTACKNTSKARPAGEGKAKGKGKDKGVGKAAPEKTPADTPMNKHKRKAGDEKQESGDEKDDVGDEGPATQPASKKARVSTHAPSRCGEYPVPDGSDTYPYWGIKQAKKEAPAARKARDELEALRRAPVPDINVDAGRRDPPQTHYWLMKSEPEVRVEDSYEIKFSIDDLAAKTTPEGWEGIRNYVARNNMRDMRKGDLAFFYHSNCKEPGVVGIMTVCKEYSPDWNACINDNPYHDTSAPHDGSKWSLVHVKLEHRFPRIVPLRLLKETAQAKDSILGNMQLLRLPRLSVTKVTREEWHGVIRIARELDADDEWDRTVEESKNLPNYSAA